MDLIFNCNMLVILLLVMTMIIWVSNGIISLN